MTRTFWHSFEPPGQSPVSGNRVSLTVDQIEDVGRKEVLQTPGPAFGAWKFLDALVAPGKEFRFMEPLGQAREVKVALSGLFGRFVVRAYLEQYLGLLYFAHLGREVLVLDGKLAVRVKRVRGAQGDLPDWIACAGGQSQLTVAEAKGSHEASWGRALNKAKEQTRRVDVHGTTGKLGVKRIAVVVRWGMLQGGPKRPWIAVHDPVEEGDERSADALDGAFMGIVRHHLGNLLEPLGHVELAGTLRRLATGANVLGDEGVVGRSRLIERAAEAGMRLRDTARGGQLGNAVIGGVVTRLGAMVGAPDAPPDLDAFAGRDLRPAFVGVSVEAIRAAVDGDAAYFRDGPPSGVARTSETATRRLEETAGRVVRLD